MATEEEIMEHFGSKPGFLGPVKPIGQVHLLADRTVANMADFICGANREGYHYAGVNWGRDLPEPEVADLRNVVEGDPATDGSGKLAIQRGIEVGHVFFLGDKYSEKLKATFLNEQGKPEPLQMGCYGIGISRIMAAAIEQNHDAKGIIWPLAMAPFEAVICPIGLNKSEAVAQQARQLYETLRQEGIDVILDDRDVRPGVMFSEWELIGVPIRITIGDRGLKDGIVELQSRSWPEGQKVPVAEMLTSIKSLYNELKNTL